MNTRPLLYESTALPLSYSGTYNTIYFIHIVFNSRQQRYFYLHKPEVLLLSLLIDIRCGMTDKILKLPKNELGRDFVVGDIHGAFDRLDQALADVGFDKSRDRLISVGDLANRGPQAAKCIEYLRHDWFYAVRGNHEEMFLSQVKDNGSLRFGSVEKFLNWAPRLSDEERKAIYQAFDKLPFLIEVETDQGQMGFVHANVPVDMSWQTLCQKVEAAEHKLLKNIVWGRTRIKAKDKGGVDGITRVFLGHTIQKKDGAKKLGNCFYMDTGAVYGELAGTCKKGFMTVADINAPASQLTRKKPAKVEFHTILNEKPKKLFGLI